MRNEYLVCVSLIDHAAETLRLEAEAELSWAPPDWTPEAALTATALCEIELAGDIAMPAVMMDGPIEDPPPIPVSYEGPGYGFETLPADALDAIDEACDDGLTAVAEMLAPAIPTVWPPLLDEVLAPVRTKRSAAYGGMVGLIACTLVGTLGWHLVTRPAAVCRVADAGKMETVGRLAANAMAARIVTAESGGDADARNPRSTATGAGQFLDGTWLDMIRAHRPDLTTKSETEILDLRYDADLSREMVARFAEGNAAVLVRRCLPVTAGTLYLAHFAGGAGAVAVLSAPDDADAATTMAEADSTGQATREKIVTANPFLEKFTVADLKTWADRKMFSAASHRLSRIW
jgi:hypothetical protein